MKIFSGVPYGARCTAFLKGFFLKIFSVRRTPHAVLVFLFLVPLPLQAATGDRVMVVSPDSRATQAALDVLKNGGNAVDAVMAAQWMLNVVEPHSSGVGGGGVFLFYDVGTRRILSFDGSVKAPQAALPNMFLGPDQQPLPYQPERNTGGLSVGIPGLLRLMEDVHAKYGTHKFSLAKLMDPAIQKAEKGVEVSPALADAILENASRLALTDPQRTVFFENGVPLKEGQKFFQPELVKGLRLIQSKGAGVFYKGAIAKNIAQIIRNNPVRKGSLALNDLEHYTIAVREPVHGSYQGYDLFSAAPPSEGGVMLFRELHLLSALNSAAFSHSPEIYHLLAEVQKVTLSNRTGVADPDLFDVPVKELLSEDWAAKRAKDINLDGVLKSDGAKVQRLEKGKKRAGSSVMVVDPQGNIAILTATLGDAFGSALRVPGYGFFLNDQLTDFAASSLAIKDPQSAALVSSGQRPRGTETPVFIFKDGKPLALLNAFGQEDPAAVLLNVIVQKIDLGASCSKAMDAPRLLVRGRAIHMEPSLYEKETIRLKLALLGHDVEKEDSLGVAQMICFEDGSGRIEGQKDPRASGEAAGF